jgi:phage-related holin
MFGYSNFTELFNSVFKNVDTELIIKYIVPFFVGIDLIFSFLFQSTEAIYFLIILYIIDFITGVSKSIYFSIKAKDLKRVQATIPQEVKDKQLKSKKFPRFLITMLVALMLLTLLKFAGEFIIVFYPLYSIFYSVFVGQQLISIIENLHDMKLLPTEIYNKIKLKINQVKNGKHSN